MKEKVLYIIAGANGSGKSTLASELLPSENLEFLNADDVAKEICPDNIESVKIKAGKIVLKRLEDLFNRKKSFAIETTLAGKNHNIPNRKLPFVAVLDNNNKLVLCRINQHLDPY